MRSSSCCRVRRSVDIENSCAPVARTVRSHQPRDKSILVVDDDSNIRSLLQQELTEAGYIVRLAEDGRKALALIREEIPGLVILDVMMPEMNGFDVAAVLKNDPATMDIPIIILSIVEDKERGFRLGVDRYLTKPIDTASLFHEVDALLDQGKSKKKVMVVDEDVSTVRTLTDVLETRGYQVVESNGSELVSRAVLSKPDIIILNSLLSSDEAVRSSALRERHGERSLSYLPMKTMKILIVDDEPHLRTLIQQSLEELEDEGVDLFTASNGEEALETIRREEPNLVFLDVMMPKKNGFDVCNAVKNELGLSHIHIILLTAKGQEFDRQRGQEVGADLYMTKPFDPDALVSEARSVLGLPAPGL